MDKPPRRRTRHSAWASPGWMSAWRKLGKQIGILRDTPTHINGLAVFAECLAVGLACEDQRRLTGSGSAQEALRGDALYKFTYFTFTLLLSGMDIMPLHIHSSLMNCFNKVIFFVSVMNCNSKFCPEMAKCSGYHSVSKFQFCQKANIAPMCCQPS